VVQELVGRFIDLHPARRERIGRVVEARKAGDSLRAIASRERVSEKQIRFDLERATAEGIAAAPPLTGVVGLDGRRRGARKPVPNQVDCSQVEVTTAPVPSPQPAMCHYCLPLGYPHCRECVLARDPGLELGIDVVIYRVRPLAERPMVGWHRCEACNAPYQGPMPRFGTPKLCPECDPKPAGRPECGELE
jgi:hypothetical protein